MIRVSGPDTYNILCKVFTKDLSDAKGYTIHHGNFLDTEGNVIDEVLVSVFRAPHSYTGEDSVEISCHASAYIVGQICDALIDCGCMMAQRGEFTKRAFLNGKMDLSQAEAVADLIASESKASHDVALGQLKGNITNEMGLLRERLIKLTTLIELELDFSDHEELEFASRDEVMQLAQTIDARIVALAHSFKAGQAIKNGVSVAIVGKTNVGKSTILNRLLKEDKAIVSDIHGTTRDVVEGTADINGITFRFTDTAGMRETKDIVEKIGNESALNTKRDAHLGVWVTDAIPTDDEAKTIMERIGSKPLVMAMNKCDINGIAPVPVEQHTTTDETTATDTQQTTRKAHETAASLRALMPDAKSIVFLAAKQGAGINELEHAIYAAADIPEYSSNDILITNTRHYDALCRAHADISAVINSITAHSFTDLIAEDLRRVIADLNIISGEEITSQTVLNNIFKSFCIGK